MLNVDTSKGDVPRDDEYLLNDIDTIMNQINNKFVN